MNKVLEVQNIEKVYRNGPREIRILSGVSFELSAGESAAVLGPSGSGKTTLLSLCAGLDQPTSGRIQLLARDLGAMSEEERAVLRNLEVGFIFQSFHLMPSLTALENVMLPLELSGNPARGPATERLIEVGLGDRLDHYPAQLSGGEQQRVAIARAFINRPKLLFADEPTGNLDRETSERVIDLLFDLNHRQGTTLLLITHDQALASRTGRLFRITKGRLEEQPALTREQPEEVRVD